MCNPGHAIRTDRSQVGFKIGEHDGKVTEHAGRLAKLMCDVAQTKVTTNLWGERWSPLHNIDRQPYDGAMEHVVIAKVTASGQLSLPAPVRRRWATSRVAIADEGDRVVVRPVPDDPIKAACGSLAGRGGRTEPIRARARWEDTAAERRRRRV